MGATNVTLGVAYPRVDNEQGIEIWYSHTCASCTEKLSGKGHCPVVNNRYYPIPAEVLVRTKALDRVEKGTLNILLQNIINLE